MPNTSLSSLPLPKEWLSHPDGMRFVRAFHLVEREDAARIAFLYGATKLKELLGKHRLPSTMDSLKLVVEADGRRVRKAERKLQAARAAAIREATEGAGGPPSGRAGEAIDSRFGRIKNANGLHTKPSSAWRAGDSYEDPYSLFDDDETEVYPHWWPKSPRAKSRRRDRDDHADDDEGDEADDGAGNEEVEETKDAVPVLAADTEWPIEMNAYAVPRRKGESRWQQQQQQQHMQEQRGGAGKPRISAAVRGGRVFDANRRAREREAIAARRGDRASTASSRAKARAKFAAGMRDGAKVRFGESEVWRGVCTQSSLYFCSLLSSPLRSSLLLSSPLRSSPLRSFLLLLPSRAKAAAATEPADASSASSTSSKQIRESRTTSAACAPRSQATSAASARSYALRSRPRRAPPGPQSRGCGERGSASALPLARGCRPRPCPARERTRSSWPRHLARDLSLTRLRMTVSGGAFS